MCARSIASALKGCFVDRFNEWIATASTKDIVAWNYDATPHQAIDEADLQLRGGSAAIWWLCDRFIHTELNDWRRSSLDWELRFAHQPFSVADAAGVPLPLLEERPTHRDMIVDAVVRRVTNPTLTDSLVAGLSRSDLRELAPLYIEDGQLPLLLELLVKAVDYSPEDSDLRSLLGFILVPFDPEAALLNFDRIKETEGSLKGIIAANRSAALARLGRYGEALRVLEQFSATNSVGTSALFWPPEEIIRASVVPRRLVHLAVGEWADQIRLLLAEA